MIGLLRLSVTAPCFVSVSHIAFILFTPENRSNALTVITDNAEDSLHL